MSLYSLIRLYTLFESRYFLLIVLKCCRYLTISQQMVEVPLADLVTTVLERCQAVLSVAKYLFTSAQIKELFRKDYFQKYG